MSNVDDLWNELQASDKSYKQEFSKRVEQKKSANRNAVASPDDILQRLNRTKISKSKKKSTVFKYSVKPLPAKSKAASASANEGEACARDATATVTSTASADINLAPKISEMIDQNQSVQERTKMLLMIVQRDISKLSDTSVPTKEVQLAFNRLNGVLFGSTDVDAEADAEVNNTDEEILNSIFPDLMKPLLKRLADHSEKIRESAIKMLTRFLKLLLDVSYLLPYFFPALMDRCSNSFEIDFENNLLVRDKEEYEAKMRGKAVAMPDGGAVYSHKVVEVSEEVRLYLCELLCVLLNSILDRELHPMLSPYFHDSIMFLHASAVDPYPALKLAAFQQLQLLGDDERLCNMTHHYCTALIRSIMPSLRHRHAKVRAACIRCVTSLVMTPHKAKCKGGGSDAIVDLVGYREENVIPLCAFYGNETRINYFGFLVVDQNVMVRKEFFSMLDTWMTRLSDRWDHASRLLPFLLSALSDEAEEIQAAGLRTLGECGAQYEAEHPDDVIEKRQYGLDGAKGKANYAKALPAPWSARPRLGERLYVRTHCRRFLKPVLNELGDWRSKTKEYASGLLRTCLVYMEEHVTMELHLLMNTLVSLCDDDAVATQMAQCAELAGRFVDPEAYLAFLLPLIKGETGIVTSEKVFQQRIRAVTVLTSMLDGSLPSRAMAHFSPLAAALCDYEVTRGCFDSSRLRTALLRSLEKVLAIAASVGTSAIDAQFLSTGRLSNLKAQYFALFKSVLYLRSMDATQSSDCDRCLQLLASAQNLCFLPRATRPSPEELAQYQTLYDSFNKSQEGDSVRKPEGLLTLTHLDATLHYVKQHFSAGPTCWRLLAEVVAVVEPSHLAHYAQQLVELFSLSLVSRGYEHEARLFMARLLVPLLHQTSFVEQLQRQPESREMLLMVVLDAGWLGGSLELRQAWLDVLRGCLPGPAWDGGCNSSTGVIDNEMLLQDLDSFVEALGAASRTALDNHLVHDEALANSIVSIRVASLRILSVVYELLFEQVQQHQQTLKHGLKFNAVVVAALSDANDSVQLQACLALRCLFRYLGDAGSTYFMELFGEVLDLLQNGALLHAEVAEVTSELVYELANSHHADAAIATGISDAVAARATELKETSFSAYKQVIQNLSK